MNASFPTDFRSWVLSNRWWLGAFTGALLAVTGTIGGSYFSVWLKVRDHDATLTAVQADATRRWDEFERNRRDEVADRKASDAEQQAWRSDVRNQLSQIGRDLSHLQGEMQRADIFRSWRPESVPGRMPSRLLDPVAGGGNAR